MASLQRMRTEEEMRLKRVESERERANSVGVWSASAPRTRAHARSRGLSWLPDKKPSSRPAQLNRTVGSYVREEGQHGHSIYAAADRYDEHVRNSRRNSVENLAVVDEAPEDKKGDAAPVAPVSPAVLPVAPPASAAPAAPAAPAVVASSSPDAPVRVGAGVTPFAADNKKWETENAMKEQKKDDILKLVDSGYVSQRASGSLEKHRGSDKMEPTKLVGSKLVRSVSRSSSRYSQDVDAITAC
ncbi:MAG: hypothetical protein Q9226_009211 [Calogaya cf. arnoldii]